ncbi:MAG: hypothetical protein ACI9U2_004632 [Bradymonadia bacterium]|jgi:hypothetical protein
MRVLVLAAALLATSALVSSAAADVRYHLSFSVFGRSVPSLDLAAKAEVRDFGAADDAGALSMGVLASLGVEVSRIEIGIDHAQGAGGLDQGTIDQRYFGGGDEPTIGATTTETGAHVWWVIRYSPDLQFMVGPHVRWLGMVTSSDAGKARVKALGVGGQVGLRARTNKITANLDGSLRVMGSLHGNYPLRVSVRSAETGVLFENNDPAGLFADYGVSVGYCLTFK